MRVLLALYRDDPSAGGSLRVGQTLAKGLRKLGVEAEVCFAYGSAGPVGAEGLVPCHYLGLRNSRDVLRWHRLRGLLKDRNFQVVHFVDPLLWMHLASAGMNIRRVVHVHGRVHTGPPIATVTVGDRLGWKLFRGRADAVVCISQGSRRSLVAMGLAKQEKTRVVYNAVDFQYFQARPSRDEARRRLGLPLDIRIVGMVCRLDDGRFCDDLIRMLPMLDAQWHALLVGDGPHKSNLEHFTEKAGLRNRVWFTGSLDDVRPAYSAMDAYVFLAAYDSFGMAMAEAMSSRVPVFGLEGEGEYREPENPLVTAGNAFFLKRAGRCAYDERSKRWTYNDPENPDLLTKLAERIAAYGRDCSPFAGMVEGAWNHVRQRFSMEVQAKAMLQVYQQVLSGERFERMPKAAS